MPTMIVWAVVAGLLIINILLRTRVLKLEAQLKQLRHLEYITYLREQNAQTDKFTAIKALRKQYPELSLVDASQLWQQR